MNAYMSQASALASSLHVRLSTAIVIALLPLLFSSAQPKLQLETFRAWAGISSDISFYLNSHRKYHACLQYRRFSLLKPMM
jgi:hypothetical protein